MDRVIRWTALACILLFVAGCTGVDDDDGRHEGSATRTDPEAETRAMNAALDSFDVMAGVEPSVRGTVSAPDGLTSAVDQYRVSDLFRMASGYYVSHNNLPALYAHNGGFTISAPQFERHYAPDELDRAVRDFSDLLEQRRYFTVDP